MKTLQLLIAILLLSSFTVNASNTEVKNKNSENSTSLINKEIDNIVKYPKFAKDENIQGFVVVEYQIDTYGQIKVLNTNADNDLLRNYIINVLENKTLQNTPANDMVMVAKFKFLIK